MEAEARLIEARGSGEGLYEAVLELRYGGRSYRLSVPRLIRRPAEARARLSGDYILIDLVGEDGAPVATCCIHRGHVERGCMECKSLLLPPRGEGKG